MQRIDYGSHPEQFFHLHEPAGQSEEGEKKKPVIMVIHGGYWAQYYNLQNSLIDGLVPFFQSQGFWVCHLEYRRGNQTLDRGEGGWPETNEDIIRAMNRLEELASEEAFRNRIDLESVAILGHSAGGTLALWPCCSGASTVNQEFIKVEKFPKFIPKLCIAVAPVGNLLDGFIRKLSDSGKAVENYLKCQPVFDKEHTLSQDSPYRLASPDMLLPMRTRLLVVAGDNDNIVPLGHIKGFYEKALHSYIEYNADETIPPPELVVIPGADHFQIVNPTTEAWQQIYPHIERLIQN